MKERSFSSTIGNEEPPALLIKRPPRNLDKRKTRWVHKPNYSAEQLALYGERWLKGITTYNRRIDSYVSSGTLNPKYSAHFYLTPSLASLLEYLNVTIEDFYGDYMERSEDHTRVCQHLLQEIAVYHEDGLDSDLKGKIWWLDNYRKHQIESKRKKSEDSTSQKISLTINLPEAEKKPTSKKQLPGI